MGAIYKNYKAGNVQHAIPGYSVRGWIIPLAWIDTFPVVVGNAVAGNRKTVDANFVLKAGKAAIEVYFAKDSVSGDGEYTGEELARRNRWIPKGSIPGDTPELLDMVEGLINDNFILLVEDANSCADGSNQLILFGSICDPVTVIGGGFKSGTLKSGRKQHDMEFETYSKLFFNGVLEVLDDETEVPA